LPNIREDNLQIFRVMEMVQAACREAVANGRAGRGGRIKFEDLPYASGGTLADWNWPAVSDKEPLAKLAVKS
jgi:hypothetical protein